MVDLCGSGFFLSILIFLHQLSWPQLEDDEKKATTFFEISLLLPTQTNCIIQGLRTFF